MRVGERDQYFLDLAVDSAGASGAGHSAHLLGGGEHEEGVRLGAEVEVFSETAGHQELGVSFQLEQVVLAFPRERDDFEFSKVLLLRLRVGSVLHGAHVVENELLAPLDHALDHVEREHPQTVQDVGALVEEGGLHSARLLDIGDDL